MANHKSAAKRARQTLSKNKRNHGIKKTIRTIEKKLRASISSKSKKEAEEQFKDFTVKTDKAAQKGILQVNTASRKISRLAKAVVALK